MRKRKEKRKYRKLRVRTFTNKKYRKPKVKVKVTNLTKKKLTYKPVLKFMTKKRKRDLKKGSWYINRNA